VVAPVKKKVQSNLGKNRKREGAKQIEAFSETSCKSARRLTVDGGTRAKRLSRSPHPAQILRFRRRTAPFAVKQPH
jgi:hypothetical protein